MDILLILNINRIIKHYISILNVFDVLEMFSKDDHENNKQEKQRERKRRMEEEISMSMNHSFHCQAFFSLNIYRLINHVEEMF